MRNSQLIQGDWIEVLRTMPDESVHCVVTSPPYWGLRDYGVTGQLGLERTPDEYVAKMVEGFREVRRVLRNDGTLWLNLGDAYVHGVPGGGCVFANGRTQGDRTSYESDKARGREKISTKVAGLKTKDLVGIPWLIAFALRSDGWYLRQDIIWAKPNPMPESVRDRCTKAHEYIFLLSKSERYYYDQDAIREPLKDASVARLIQDVENQEGSARVPGKTNGNIKAKCGKDFSSKMAGGGGINANRSGYFDKDTGEPLCGTTANKKSVWQVTTKGYSEAHFATFPPEIPEICIKAGTSEWGCCKKCGAPWERVTERTPMVIARSERTHSKGDTRSSGTMLEPPKSETIGCRPTCKCYGGNGEFGQATPAPCTVLDPFNGAGTTGLVATRLGRDYIGIELNPEYMEMARRRIEGDAPLFNTFAEAANAD
jgi:DNA modification methylase